MVDICFNFIASPAKMKSPIAEEPPMPFRRLTGSDRSIRQATATGSTGAFAMRRDAHAHMANSMQARLARGRNLSTGHDQSSQKAATGLLENDFANGRARIGRPRFARLHASIAERPLDWAWHASPDIAGLSDKSERSEAGSAETGFSGRALWLGGLAFALLPAGVIFAGGPFFGIAGPPCPSP